MLDEKLYHKIKNQLVETYPEDRWWAVYEGKIPIDEAKREYEKFLAERGWDIYRNVRRENWHTREHIEWLAKWGRNKGENYEVLCKKLVDNQAIEIELFNVINDLTNGKQRAAKWQKYSTYLRSSQKSEQSLQLLLTTSKKVSTLMQSWR